MEKPNVRMKKSNVSIERYCDGEWYFDIVSSDGIREAWLGHNEYGVSLFMFGIPVRQEGRPAMFFWQFLKMVEENAESYKREYKEQYIN